MIRQSLHCERVILKEFVCNAHIAKSGFSEEAIQAQLEDLPNDFPELIFEEQWNPLLSWIYSDKEEATSLNDIYGCIGVRIVDSNTVYLVYLYVNESHQGKGIGRRLLQQTIQWADNYTRNSCRIENNTPPSSRCMTLYTLKNVMTSAIGLYLKEGFEIIEEKDVSCFCLLTMRLDLDKKFNTVEN